MIIAPDFVHFTIVLYPSLRWHSCSEQEAKIVVSPSGVVHAVHPETREVIWKYESGSGMGCKLQAVHSHLNSDVDKESDDQTVFSGPDGRLYILRRNEVEVSIRECRLLCPL